jgi:hypothetical protein
MPARSSECSKRDANKQEQRTRLGATDARQAAVVQAAYILESRTR